MKNLLKTALLFCILAAASCNTDDGCRKSRYMPMNVGIYKVSYNATTKIRTITSSTDTLTIKGIDIDSILYYKKKVSSIILPLNKLDTINISQFQVTQNNVIDTITIQHKNTNQYLSLECGCIKTHTIDTVMTTNHYIDSVRISYHYVNTSTSATEHIKIYNR